MNFLPDFISPPKTLFRLRNIQCGYILKSIKDPFCKIKSSKKKEAFLTIRFYLKR